MQGLAQKVEAAEMCRETFVIGDRLFYPTSRRSMGHPDKRMKIMSQASRGTRGRGVIPSPLTNPPTRYYVNGYTYMVEDDCGPPQYNVVPLVDHESMTYRTTNFLKRKRSVCEVM